MGADARIRRAIDQYLRARAHERCVPLYTVACVADREAGRELSGSLAPYLRFLPKGARAVWVAEGTGHVWCVLNPHSVARLTGRLTAGPEAEYERLALGGGKGDRPS